MVWVQEEKDVSGSWETGIPYEARTLLFKALNNLIERSLLTRWYNHTHTQKTKQERKYPGIKADVSELIAIPVQAPFSVSAITYIIHHKGF